jgi:hypothetical protein
MNKKQPTTPFEDFLARLNITDPEAPDQQKMILALYEAYNRISSIAIMSELNEDQVDQLEAKQDELGDDIEKYDAFINSLGIDVDKIRNKAFSEFSEEFFDDLDQIDFSKPLSPSDKDKTSSNK